MIQDSVGEAEGEVSEEVWVGRERKVLSPSLWLSEHLKLALQDLWHWCGGVDRERATQARGSSGRSTGVPWT